MSQNKKELGLGNVIFTTGRCKDSCRIHLMQPFSMIFENYIQEHLD